MDAHCLETYYEGEPYFDLALDWVTVDQGRAWVAQRDATLNEFARQGINPKNTPTWNMVNTIADALQQALNAYGEEEE